MRYVLLSRVKNASSHIPWKKVIELPKGSNEALAQKELKWLADHSLWKEYALIKIDDPLNDTLEGVV